MSHENNFQYKIITDEIYSQVWKRLQTVNVWKRDIGEAQKTECQDSGANRKQSDKKVEQIIS